MTILPYQRAGAEWLSDRDRALLGDVPGLGKTRTALYAALLRGAQRVQVIAPAIARAVWPRELDTLMSTSLVRRPDLRVESYSRFAMSAEARDEIELFDPDLLILDEVHYLKHEESIRTSRLLGRLSWLKRARSVWGLSGTPMPRHPHELWPIAIGLWPDAVMRELKIGTESAWRDQFTLWKPTKYGPKVFGAKNVAQLRAFLEGKMLRRTEAEVLPDLPPIRWTVTPMSVDSVTSHYADIAMRDRPIPFDAAGQLARERHVLGDLKVPYALDLIKAELDADPDEKRIVFAYHRSALHALRAGLKKYGVAYIDGDTSAEDRKDAEEAFQINGDSGPRVFLGQIEAAGMAITLTAANHVDIVEPDWRTDMNVQAGKRAHRLGQAQPVLVRMLTMADTLDDAIVRHHHREVEMAARVLD